ncbi:hypothetical protein [Magnetospirillum sp. UT-4]|uniref:hypothetical protein n=1 Tax=Magnetospirillum sp. UT-4 TaxID=2681467 RepID=UPI00138159A0|nr:hypothetical protein [Magnetospirillum sp. UT-4]CAA7614977.1 hypothetical protein MTBUT4_20015 [Magnetospirillum sp. UT-4]
MHTQMIGYIISCLPSNERREERLAAHNQQIDELGAHTDLPLVILAMGYQPHEFHDTLGDRIRYITLGQPVPPAEARNICLRDFYASGYRWAALMDNDAALYHSPTHNSGYHFIGEMTAQIDRYDNIGLFYPINPMQTPFRARWEDSGYFTNHVFERGISAKGTLVFVRNFAQFGQKPIYQDPAFTFMEDNAFAFAVLAAKQTVFQNWNMVLKELVAAGPLSFFGDMASRGPRGALARQQIVAKFATDGLRLNTNGNLNTRAMVNRCWPSGVPSMVVVPKPALPVIHTPSLVASSKKEV